MDSINDVSFSSDLLHYSAQQAMGVDLGVLTPSCFKDGWGGEEFNATNIEKIEIINDDDLEQMNDGMDEQLSDALSTFCAEVECRQAKEKKNNKINIINYTVLPPPPPPSSKLKTILTTPRCITNKVAHKFYDTKMGSHEITDQLEVKEVSVVEDQHIQTMEMVFDRPPSPIITRKRKSGRSTTLLRDTELKPTLDSAMNKSVCNVRHNNIATVVCDDLPQWVSEIELTNSEKNAVGMYYKAGNAIRREIEFLRSDERQIEEDIRLLQEQFEADMHKLRERLAGVSNNLEIRNKKLRHMSNINFL